MPKSQKEYRKRPTKLEPMRSEISSATSKAPVLRVNNNNDNLSIDVLYFVPENLKKVQESC
jgi:hypothetical protein